MQAGGCAVLTCFAAVPLVMACSPSDDGSAAQGQGATAGQAAGGAAGAGGVGGAAGNPNANADGDCMTDAEEIQKGTNPSSADSDGDAISDCDEIACGSNPTDGAELCYKCGWRHDDPGNLASTGRAVGDVIENISLIDQCGETLPLWELAGQYRLLFMTTVW